MKRQPPKSTPFPYTTLFRSRRVVPPAFLGGSDFVVAIQKADPIASGISPGDTDQLGAEPRNDEAEAVCFVGQNIERPIAPLFFALREAHRQLREQPAGVLRFHQPLDSDRHGGGALRNLVGLRAPG